MSSKKFADKMIIFLDKYKHYSEKDKKIVHYGLETIYILITKTIFITFISLFFGITKEMYIFIFFFAILRIFACGLHMSTSLQCTTFSSIMFIILPITCKHINLSIYIHLLFFTITIIIFYIYSPADTIKKPLINIKKRKKLKFQSLLIVLIYLIIFFTIKNTYITNCISISLIAESIMILPITYKIFKQPYKNYKNYM